MKNYSLSALLKVREHKKNVAEGSLREAAHHHALEKKKLEQIETSLRDTILARAQLQNNFFLKAQASPCNKREVLFHISSSQKNICDESALRRSLTDQEELVKCAAIKLELATKSAVDANRNLKTIEKHYFSWQQSNKRAEQIKEEYDSDDQNGARYVLKKRA